MLDVSGLRVGYDGTPVLRDVSLHVDDGEVVGLVGKNGVGKTTLVKAIVGLLECSAGTIRYDGEEVTEHSADQLARRGIGYVPQSRNVFGELTVEENLLVGESVNEAATEPRYDLVYEYFPILEERATQDAGTLSGGQQQMLAIGRALVGDPALLVLDEPSEGVQPSIVQQIGRDVRSISEETGLTVVLVEQHLGLIQSLSQRCYALDRGTVVEELSRDAVQDRDTIADYLAV